MAGPAAEMKASPALPGEPNFASCECCGLLEECTPAYIVRVRDRYYGRWICGLCAEAVKDEIVRAGGRITGEEALARHLRFSSDFRFRDLCQHQAKSAEHLIAAMRQLLRRGLESTRSLSTPASPRRRKDEGGDGVGKPSLTRSDSCFPTIAG
ncbi:hypothetical protein KSP39_PZI016489 [Platanthera zijinensis]|uniref:DUF1677 family protein n=1 Tax=Platanthera zijinensis TaxID=2320716 RepID=A0AAP0B729_9ASPA